MALCNPCVRTADSSMTTCLPRPTTSLKLLLRRRLFSKTNSHSSKRSAPIRSSHKPTHCSGRFQRVKGSNLVREVNPNFEESIKTDNTSNYDMTILHDEFSDDTQVATSRQQSKRIPRWARKSQLQMAIINQIYFQDKNPEDIFGTVRLDLAREMIQSIEYGQKKSFSCYPAFLPANFV